MEHCNIVCLVKIIPDVEQMAYDPEKNILVREQKKSILNPEDASAVAAALGIKKKYPAQVTVVTMGPPMAKKYLEDLLRRGVDRVVLLTDDAYRGSDTYVTARILARCLGQMEYDLIFTGTHSLDGDTAHIPAQVAELLDCQFMSHATKLQPQTLKKDVLQLEVSEEEEILTFSLDLPAVVGISAEGKFKLPFVRYDDLKKDVSSALTVLTNQELSFAEDEVGLLGSKTTVIKSYPKQPQEKEKVVVQNDEAGIDYVYHFLKEKGFLQT